jgi:hypothetical protein
VALFSIFAALYLLFDGPLAGQRSNDDVCFPAGEPSDSKESLAMSRITRIRYHFR